MCSVVVFVAAVAPGVAPLIEGEAVGLRRRRLLPPQQPALATKGAASARVTKTRTQVTESTSCL